MNESESEIKIIMLVKEANALNEEAQKNLRATSWFLFFGFLLVAGALGVAVLALYSLGVIT